MIPAEVLLLIGDDVWLLNRKVAFCGCEVALATETEKLNCKVSPTHYQAVQLFHISLINSRKKSNYLNASNGQTSIH